MSKLVSWKTPFAATSLPSVWISTEGELRDTVIFVQAEQLWRIQFAAIVRLKVCEETYDENTRFHIERDDDEVCSYFWENSPWVNEFNAEHAEFLEDSKLKHYVLFGGDYNIEILALGDFQINQSTATG